MARTVEVNVKLLLVLAAFGLVIIYQSVITTAAQNQSQQTFDGIQCLLVQLQQHRVGNRDTEYQIAEAVGLQREDIVVNPAVRTPGRIDIDLLKKCEQFYGPDAFVVVAAPTTTNPP